MSLLGMLARVCAGCGVTGGVWPNCAPKLRLLLACCLEGLLFQPKKV